MSLTAFTGLLLGLAFGASLPSRPRRWASLSGFSATSTSTSTTRAELPLSRTARTGRGACRRWRPWERPSSAATGAVPTSARCCGSTASSGQTFSTVPAELSTQVHALTWTRSSLCLAGSCPSPGARISSRRRRATPLQRLLDEVAQHDFPGLLESGLPGLHRDPVGVAEPQLEDLLDTDHALTAGDRGGQAVEHGRLAGLGAARDEDVEPRAHRRLEEACCLWCEAAQRDQVGEPVGAEQELAGC